MYEGMEGVVNENWIFTCNSFEISLRNTRKCTLSMMNCCCKLGIKLNRSS